MRSTPCEIAGLQGVEVPGLGPTLLFIHGNSADHRTFEPLLHTPALAGYHRVALDLPGHGGTPAPGVISLRGLAAAIGAAADALGAAVVVSHSLGGHLTLQALGHGLLPGVRGVMVQGTPPIPGAAGLGIAFRPTASMGLIFQENLDDEAIRTWGEEAFGPLCAVPPWFAEAVRATHPSVRPGLAASVATEGLLDEVSVVATSPVPIAVLDAEHDPFCAPEHMARLTGPRLWRGAVQPLAACGHYAPWERPEAVAAVLADFLRDVLPS